MFPFPDDRFVLIPPVHHLDFHRIAIQMHGNPNAADETCLDTEVVRSA